MPERESTQVVRTIKARDLKPPWEVRELPEPPPLSGKGIFQWAGPAVILGALAVGGFEVYHAGFVAAQAYVTLMVITLKRKLLPEKIRPRGFSLAINLIWTLVLLAYFAAWTFKDRPF